jgi:protein-tyrosine phosphatase/membrane-associated phospholipid phosphatase
VNLPCRSAEAPPQQRGDPIPWRRGLGWLLFLGPFFFLSYGFANGWAASRADVGTIVFDWERQIPFLAWTILPYWSIDLLYGLSFLLCRDRRAVDTHAFRLLTVQLVAIACFLAFPLRFSFERPVVDGIFGMMIDALMRFDQPFNQAPSLHIALLLVLWVRYAAASRGVWRIATHLWAVLIGVSVLTTYQHHFIDVPTGALLGLFSLWLWPDNAPGMLATWRFTADRRRRQLGGYYGLAAAALFATASLGGATRWLVWPASSLTLVSLNYFGLGSAGFQNAAGQLSAASAWLLAPYRFAAWLNSRWWTRDIPKACEIADQVWLGRIPTAADVRQAGFSGLVDLTAEFSTPGGASESSAFPCLDLVVPDVSVLAAAACDIERLRQRGPVLVFCALGFSRSALAVAAWLLQTGRASNPRQAGEMLQAAGTRVVFGPAHWAALGALAGGKSERSLIAGAACGELAQ